MFLKESSLKDLYKTTVEAFPLTTKRQHATDEIIIENLRWVPFLGVKTLFIKGRAKNIQEKTEYDCIILFKKVDYQKNEVTITADDLKEYHFGKLSYDNTDVLIRCGCKDFFWRWHHTDHVDKSLQGPNRKKYEGQGLWKANPLELPGACKHILKMVKVLTEAHIFA